MNASERRNAIRRLENLGFWPDRYTKHGVMWTNGHENVLLARKTRGDDPRAFRNLDSLLRRLEGKPLL